MRPPTGRQAAGYGFHVTRADEWSKSDRNPITAEEWLAAVAEDPELRPEPASGPYFAVWRGGKGRQALWFDWADGRAFTTDPRRDQLAKMVQLAHRLGARVQGDDGEFYPPSEETPESESFDAVIGANHRRADAARPWWRFW